MSVRDGIGQTRCSLCIIGLKFELIISFIVANTLTIRNVIQYGTIHIEYKSQVLKCIHYSIFLKPKRQ